jgi:hypothetical protein
MAVVVALTVPGTSQPDFRMYPTDPPAGRIRRVLMAARTPVSLQWCQLGGNSTADLTTGPLSVAALRDLKAAGVDGVVLDDADSDAAIRAAGEGLLTTASAAMRGRQDGIVARALHDLLGRSGDGARPSAFAKSIGEWMSDARTSYSVLAFAVPADATITEASTARGGGQDAARAERLLEIASLVCAALPGNAVWAQDQLQAAGTTGTATQPIEYRRALLRIRRDCAALTRGSLSVLVADNEDSICAFGRVLPDSVAVVVVNNADRDRTVEIPGVRLTARGAREGIVLKTVVQSVPARGTRGGIVVPTATTTVAASAMTVNLPPMSALLMVSDK